MLNTQAEQPVASMQPYRENSTKKTLLAPSAAGNNKAGWDAESIENDSGGAETAQARASPAFPL